jgi:DNA replication and repair protein RecF
VKILGARVQGFRNLADAEYEFSSGVNVLQGDNGHGKTNLLEALNFVALGRSHRGARVEELIGHQAAHLHVCVTVRTAVDNVHVLEFGLDRDGGRRFRVDGEAVAHRADLIGQLATVFFWPQSNELVRGGPEHRRRFADQGLSSLDRDYMRALTAHQRALRQKTRLLKDLGHGGRVFGNARRELVAWNADLAKHAAAIGVGRARWAQGLAPHAAAMYGALTDTPAPLAFAYRPRLLALAALAAGSAEKNDLVEDILAEIDYIGPDEMRRGRPLTGPQFDDFDVRLGSLDLRAYGSQGETRTAAMSLVLAQSEVVYERRRVRPVLFLDDVFSELDGERARRLREWCGRDHQVFVATARADEVADWQPQRIRRWRVEDGRLATLP